MLLVPFTLHKVQKYFSAFRRRRKEENIRWLSLEACDPPELGWRDTDGWNWYRISFTSKDTILKSFPSFTLPTGNQLVPDSIMRLVWCGCKSGIPSSTRDFDYKKYGFGLLDVHVQLYRNILCMFWFQRKFKCLKCILSRYRFQSIWNHFIQNFLNSINSLNSTYGSENRFSFQNHYSGLVNKEVLEFRLYEMSDILNFSNI
jgi:hypothetical protein